MLMNAFSVATPVTITPIQPHYFKHREACIKIYLGVQKLDKIEDFVIEQV